MLQAAGNVVATLAGHTHRVRLFWRGCMYVQEQAWWPFVAVGPAECVLPEFLLYFVSSTLRGCMQDGYAQDGSGIHHRVCTGVVETRPGTDWWACQTSTYALPYTWTPWQFKAHSKPPCAVLP